jgi:hypothetical protein
MTNQKRTATQSAWNTTTTPKTAITTSHSAVNYHEHIICDDEEYYNIVEYIEKIPKFQIISGRA